ncbi:hypothetical protein [Sulfurirhabdus autotrophica]|uniref:hypothetical protein n=1 Tax=Sulfurirhabdus autotrophica TaxID=1706046 RepID=UPI000F60FE26|nr:hypothetical protein [Sulfurirhabdus autotrophica]
MKNEGTEAANTLGELLTALDAGLEFRLVKLYELPYDAFELALHLLKEWRLASYTSKMGDLPNALQLASIAPENSWLNESDSLFFDLPAVE